MHCDCGNNNANPKTGICPECVTEHLDRAHTYVLTGGHSDLTMAEMCSEIDPIDFEDLDIL